MDTLSTWPKLSSASTTPLGAGPRPAPRGLPSGARHTTCSSVTGTRRRPSRPLPRPRESRRRPSTASSGARRRSPRNSSMSRSRATKIRCPSPSGRGSHACSTPTSPGRNASAAMRTRAGGFWPAPARRSRSCAAARTATPSWLSCGPPTRPNGARWWLSVVEAAADDADLRTGLDRARAADVLYALHGPELFHALVHEAGWDLDTYEAWLGTTFCESLLAKA